MNFLLKLFTWWDGATIGTSLFSAMNGEQVGTDAQGNTYFRSKTKKTTDGRERRWVIYDGANDASRVPAEWHGWLHHTYAEPPTIDPPKVQSWEIEHIPNLTGTPYAYRPSGSLLASGQRPPATGDYEAWHPE